MKKEVIVMNIEESIQQISTLIEAWQLDEADLNQTDINAMKTLLEENQQLNEKTEKLEKARKEAIELINSINDWEVCSK